MMKSFNLLPLLAMMVLAVLAGGCAQTQTVVSGTKPADANIHVDGVDRGRGPITEQFVFKSAADVHRITAFRLGYKDTTATVTRDYDRNDLLIKMKPQTRDINIIVSPVP